MPATRPPHSLVGGTGAAHGNGATEEPTLDTVLFAELRELGPSFLSEVIAEFASQTDPMILLLREAFESHDISEVARLCHAIKGSGAQLGARRLRACCNRLERRANLGHLSDGEADLADIEAEYKEFRRSLAEQLEIPESSTENLVR